MAGASGKHVQHLQRIVALGHALEDIKGCRRGARVTRHTKEESVAERIFTTAPKCSAETAWSKNRVIPVLIVPIKKKLKIKKR